MALPGIRQAQESWRNARGRCRIRVCSKRVGVGNRLPDTSGSPNPQMLNSLMQMAYAIFARFLGTFSHRLHFLFYVLCVFGWGVRVHRSKHGKVRGQLREPSFLLLPSGSWESNSGAQVLRLRGRLLYPLVIN